LSGGEQPDYRQAENLIAEFEFDYLIADKGYDSSAFVESVRETGADAIVISAKLIGIFIVKDI
jgi:hypothetical protein